jgi:hypothetical protein
LRAVLEPLESFKLDMAQEINDFYKMHVHFSCGNLEAGKPWADWVVSWLPESQDRFVILSPSFASEFLKLQVTAGAPQSQCDQIGRQDRL